MDIKTQIMDIDNYIIDFGGVLYEISPARTISEFSKLTGLPIESISNENLYRRYIRPYEEGLMPGDKFRELVNKELGLKLTDEEFDKVWNMTLVGIYHDSMEIISQLSAHATLYLMSNTNTIHYNRFEPECRDMFAYFRKRYLSFEAKLIKPDREFFEFIIRDAAIEPSRTLFIDDTIENIKTAEQLGLQVLFLNDRKKLSDLLHNVKFVKH
jgi:putative hydrolase of the HAD superfamily